MCQHDANGHRYGAKQYPLDHLNLRRPMKAPLCWWAAAPLQVRLRGLLFLRTGQADAAPGLTVQWTKHLPPTPNPHLSIPEGDVTGLLRGWIGPRASAQPGHW